MAAPGKRPKIMSSRLAGMKFMQRSTGSPTTPSNSSEPPSKRQRLSNAASIDSSPATTVEQANVTKSYQASVDQSESKWYLSYQAPKAPTTESPLRIVTAGYSALDSAERDVQDADDEETGQAKVRRPQIAGRKSFGNFNRKIEKQHNPDLSSESEEDAEDDDEGDEGEVEDDPTGVKALILKGRKEASERARAERQAKRKADSAESAEFAALRRKKEVNLNHITSISGGGGGGTSNIVCHGCHKKGHLQKDCPQRRSGPRRSY